MSQTGSEGSGRSSQRKKLMWRQKELEVERKAWLDTHEKKLEEIPEDDKPFTTMLKEMREKSKPLEKGSDSSQPLEDTKTEPLEKGTEASASSAPPLEKGTEAAASKTQPLEKGTEASACKTEPLEKGTEASASKTEPLEKGTETSASSAPPLEKGSDKSALPLKKGKVMVDYYNVLFVGSTIPPGSLSAILLLQEGGFQPVICSFCGKEREADVMATLQKYELLKDLELIFTNQRTGSKGKGAICVSEEMVALFDDSKDILQDTLEKGQQIYPIKSPKEDHKWWSKLGGKVFEALKPASSRSKPP